MENSKKYILAIESSCDDTSAAVLCHTKVLSNVVATQEIHKQYGGVVPELASRAHQQNIVPVVHQALAKANIDKKQLSAIAFTRGPGLMGSLLVGTSFAKSLALGLNIPLIEVNHMEAHILAHFIEDKTQTAPTFPFLAMTISGGHTQIVKVSDYFEMEVMGETLDDAVGEAFDKSAKLMGLPYPGGPLIDKYAKLGYSNLGIKVCQPKFSSASLSLPRIPELAATPPPMAICFIPVCSTAICNFSINISKMVNCTDAQISFMFWEIKSGFFWFSRCKK